MEGPEPPQARLAGREGAEPSHGEVVVGDPVGQVRLALREEVDVVVDAGGEVAEELLVGEVLGDEAVQSRLAGVKHAVGIAVAAFKVALVGLPVAVAVLREPVDDLVVVGKPVRVAVGVALVGHAVLVEVVRGAAVAARAEGAADHPVALEAGEELAEQRELGGAVGKVIGVERLHRRDPPACVERRVGVVGRGEGRRGDRHLRRPHADEHRRPGRPEVGLRNRMQRLVQRNPSPTRDRLDRDDQFGVEGNPVAVEILPHRHGHRAALVEHAVDDLDPVDRLLPRLDDVVDDPADRLGVAEVGSDGPRQFSGVGLVVAIELLEFALVRDAVGLAVLTEAERDVLGVVDPVLVAVFEAGEGRRSREEGRQDPGEVTTQAG